MFIETLPIRPIRVARNLMRVNEAIPPLATLGLAALAGACVTVVGVSRVELLGALPLLLMAAAQPAIGLFLLVTSLPVVYWARATVFGLTVRPFELLAIVMLPMLLLRRRGAQAQTLPLWQPILIYLTSIALSTFVSILPGQTLRQVSIEVLGFAMMWSVYLAADSQERILGMIKLLLWLGVLDGLLIGINTLLSVGGLPTFLPLAPPDPTFLLPFPRPNGLLGEPDRTAEFHLILLLITIPLRATRQHDPRLVSWKLLLTFSLWCNLFLVIAGAFRGALVGLGLGWTAYLWISRHGEAKVDLRWLSKAVAVAAMLAAVLVLPFGDALRATYLQRLNLTLLPLQGEEGIHDSELVYVIANLQDGLDHPVLGNGYGTQTHSRRIQLIQPSYALLSANEDTAFSASTTRPVAVFYGAGIVGLAGFLLWQLSLLKHLLSGVRRSGISLALFLPFVGVFWGHDLFRAVALNIAMMTVIGLALAWQKFDTPYSLE